METKFWSLVDKTTACWFWSGRIMQKGYGVFWDGNKNWRAHRLSYLLVKGNIPDKLQLDHLCRNRNCVNPEHLEPVTNRENILRGGGLAAQNARKTHCFRGHEFNEENTHIAPRGARICRPCNRIRNKKELEQ